MKQFHYFPLLFVVVLSTGVLADDFEKEGIVCVKQRGAMETVTYLGLVNIDQVVFTGIRTENSITIGDRTKHTGSTLLLDDGRGSELYSWNEGVTMILPKESESVFPPDEIGLSIMMGKRIYGECNSWLIDPQKLQKPMNQL